MARYQFWLLIGLVVVFGVALEYVKSPGMKEKAWRNSHSPFATYEDEQTAKPEAITSPELQPLSPTTHIAGTQPARNKRLGFAAPILQFFKGTPETPAAPPTDCVDGADRLGNPCSTETPKDAKTDCVDGKDKEGKECKVEEKKDDQDKAKKTADGKNAQEEPNAGAPVVEVAGGANTSDGDKADKKSNSGADTPAGATYRVVSLVRPKAAQNANGDIPQDLQKWLDVIMKEPDFKLTTKLVQYYQTSLVTEQVFFGVIAAMLNDPREKMHELAIIALSSTPSLQSLVLLNRFVDNERGLSSEKRQAQDAIGKYADVQYLNVLASIIQTPNSPSLSMQGLRLLTQTGETSFKALTPPPASGNPPQPEHVDGATTSSTSTAEQQKKFSQASRSFQPFVSILSKVSQHNSDQDLRQAASIALQKLQGWLGTGSEARTQARN